MPGTFDPDRLRLRVQPTLRIGPRKAAIPKPRLQEKFLKGPISWPWLTLAARQPGKAFHVAIMLWFLAGITRKRVIALSLTRMSALGISRYAAARGLKALEQVGLVSVERHDGR